MKGLKLFYHLNRYDLKKTEKLFLNEVKMNLIHHIKRCPEYEAILKNQNFLIEDIKTIDDLQKIPPMSTLFLKQHTLLSMDKNKMFFPSTTSGTSGKTSFSGLDLATVIRGCGMIANTYLSDHLVTLFPTNYVILGYEPTKRNQMGVVKTMYGNTFASPALHRVYALKDTGSEYELNLEGIKQVLLKFEKQGHRVRFMGFPSYFMFLLQELKESNIKLKLHPKSIILLAGGWKQFFAQKIDKEELYKLSEEVLGLNENSFHEIFSAVEHPIIYTQCKNHHFHIPIYSRVILRDPVSLKPVEKGQPGIMNFITPMITSMPFTSVMTDDIAIMHDGCKCGCGIESDYFEVLGRAGLEDIKTCATGASELLNIAKKAGEL